MRADRLLVERGLFESRARAQSAIAAGGVTADGEPVRRASDLVAVSAALEATAEHPYVSRGGVKLAFALDRFGFDPAGLACLDVGASTGGFTDVLLRRGARFVTAIDAGTDQLHPSLRANRAVRVLEQTDIRDLAPGALQGLAEAAVVDVSFISLRHVLPALARLVATASWMVALVKPQFEAGRRHLKKGIVRDAAVHEAVCADAAVTAASLGWRVEDIIESPLRGGEGNREFLLGARCDR